MSRARDLADSADLSFDGSTLSIDSTNNRVGIGTTSPSTALEVADNDSGNRSTIRIRRTDIANSDVDLSTGAGGAGKDFTISVNQSERMRIDSSGNIGIGGGAASLGRVHIDDGGNRNYFTAETTTDSASYEAGLRIATPAAYYQLFCYGNENALIFRDNNAAAERMRIKSNGFLNCLGVYTQTSGDSANVVVDASGDIKRATSALKYKKDVRDLESIDISTMRPVRFKSNIESDDQTVDHFGFIADEFHDAGLTELVSYGVVNEETGIAEVEGFRYDRMTVVLTKALQEAIAKIETLEARVDALENA